MKDDEVPDLEYMKVLSKIAGKQDAYGMQHYRTPDTLLLGLRERRMLNHPRHVLGMKVEPIDIGIYVERRNET